MRRGEINSSTKLTRQIFLYLICMVLLSVISLGFFWIESKVTSYKKDVDIIRQTYAETKKQEIKNKILEIKDYILWIQYNSEKPILNTLENQVNHLNLPVINTGEENGRLSEYLIQAFKDSIGKSRVPVYILDDKGSVIFAYNPFTETVDQKLNDEEMALLKKLGEESVKESGALAIYRYSGIADSVMIAAGYFNNVIVPGLKVVSLVRTEFLDYVLNVHLLDSISKLCFAENEYVFINAMNGKALVTHGVYNDPPKDILASGDTAWMSIFRAQQSSAAHPEGVYHTYTWALLVRPGSSGKTSYFSYIPSLEWVIGMGFYEEDVKIVIEQRKKELYSDLQKTLFNIFLFLLISTLLCYLFVLLFSRQFGNNIDLFKSFFEKAARENLLIDKSKVSYREFMFMAEAANHMVEERKQIETALKESESHYRYLFEQNPVPLLIYELGSLRILSVNEAFINHYGYSKQEILNLLIPDLLPENEREAFSENSKSLKEKEYSGEWRTLKKDGSLITVEIDSHGFQYEGHSARIAVINDITTRKKIEDEIRHLNTNLELKVNERTSLLETANKELESFSYSISHDLRAPLRHISGFIELLTKRSYDALDTRSRHYVDSILGASKHMGLLIDDLLNFSRTGRLELNLDIVNMNRALTEAISELEPETAGRTIDWKIIALPEVYADYAMIRQVWINLLSNAIKYTRKRVDTIIEIGTYDDNGESIFFVRDNGAGFDMNYSQKLFGVFQRLHNRDEFEGTGIGLANVHQVIKRHKGRTWALGEVDKGATFYFSLPKIK